MTTGVPGATCTYLSETQTVLAGRRRARLAASHAHARAGAELARHQMAELGDAARSRSSPSVSGSARVATPAARASAAQIAYGTVALLSSISSAARDEAADARTGARRARSAHVGGEHFGAQDVPAGEGGAHGDRAERGDAAGDGGGAGSDEAGRRRRSAAHDDGGAGEERQHRRAAADGVEGDGGERERGDLQRDHPRRRGEVDASRRMPKKSAAYTSRGSRARASRARARAVGEHEREARACLPAAAPAPVAPLPVNESRSEPSPAAAPRLFMRASVRTTFAESFARPARSTSAATRRALPRRRRRAARRSRDARAERLLGGAERAVLTVKRSEPSWKPICSTMPTRVLCRGSRNFARPAERRRRHAALGDAAQEARERSAPTARRRSAQPATATPASAKKSAASRRGRAATRPHRKKKPPARGEVLGPVSCQGCGASSDGNRRGQRAVPAPKLRARRAGRARRLQGRRTTRASSTSRRRRRRRRTRRSPGDRAACPRPRREIDATSLDRRKPPVFAFDTASPRA